MTYGRYPYGGVGYAGADVAEIPQNDTETTLAVEAAFTTGALQTPVWVDITADVRSWDVSRGRTRELERMQPGRATVVLGNLSRQYDSVNAAGLHFGDIRPMRRIRIRETFNGVTYPVFDGFVDKWQLDYPGVGKDATATVTATDAFKIFARTDLGRSVYANEVEADAPVIWWHLDETQSDPTTTALNAGSQASAVGTYRGPVKSRGTQTIVNLDPGTSIQVVDPGGFIDVPDQGVSIDDAIFDLNNAGSFAIEFWVIPADTPIGVDQWFGDTAATVAIRSDSNTPEYWTFTLINTTPTVFGVTGNAAGQAPNTRYHIVAKYGPNKAMAIYVNGVKFTTTAATRTAPPLTGTLRNVEDLGFLYSFENGLTPEALGDEFAIYTSVEAVDPLADARISEHHTAGNNPWQNDQPAGRIRRILAMVDWPGGPLYLPGDFVQLDSGNVSLQSASITDQTALEHLQKVAETEFGLLFIDRAGRVRFIDRASQAARLPGPETYGDGVGEVGYTDFVPDDGDDVIRNQSTISRLNGVAQTATGTTVDEFGRFQYTLDGLLHSTDSYSLDYAEFIVAEYQSARRRITSLSLGPPIDGEEDVVYPAMLGPELGDAITVQNNPVGGGAEFSQVAVIEGIQAHGEPGGVRTTTFVLSPEFTEPFGF